MQKLGQHHGQSHQVDSLDDSECRVLPPPSQRFMPFTHTHTHTRTHTQTQTHIFTDMSPLSPPPHLFFCLSHFLALDIKISWLFTILNSGIWSRELFPQILIFPFYLCLWTQLSLILFHWPEYMLHFCSCWFVCFYLGYCFYSAGLPEGWDLFWLYLS